MVVRALVAAALVVLLGLPAVAADDEVIWRGDADRLVVALALSKKPDQTIERLQDASVAGLEATPEPALVVSRGDLMAVLVFFAGCSNGSSGRCDTEMVLRVLRPDGETYAEVPAGAVWRGLPAPPRKKLQIASSNLTLLIEPEDPAGHYTVELTVRDNRADTEVVLSGSFAVAAP